MPSCRIGWRTPASWLALAGTIVVAAPLGAWAQADPSKAPDWPNLLSESGRRAAMALPKSSPWHLEPTLADLEPVPTAAATPRSAKDRFERWLAAAGTPPNVRANDPAGDQLLPAAETQSECAVAAWQQNLVAAWNDSKGLRLPASNTVSGFAHSTDGGQTWTDGGSVPLLASGDQSYGDCTLDVDDAGNFYLATIYVNTATGTQDVAVHRGTFSGTSFSWNPPVIAVNGASGPLDKPYLCVNPVDGNVYVSYTRFGATTDIEIVRGTTLGTVWSAPVVLDTSGGSQASRPFVGPEGNLYVCWAAGWGSINCNMSSTTGTIKFRRSTSPAGAFLFGATVTAGTVNHNWTSYWGGNVRGTGHYMPDMGVDRSGGSNNGHIYITWNEAAPWGTPAGSGTSVAETEANDSPGDANVKSLIPGDDATGTISSTGDFDYWKINLVAGQHVLMRLEPQGFACGVTNTTRNFQIRLFSGAAADTFLAQSNLNQFASEIVFDAPETATYFFRVRNMNSIGTTTGTYAVRTRVLTYGAPSPARDMRDIVLVESTNLGVSFGSESLVNDDPANLDEAIPALTVDALGHVNVFYYDCRDALGTRALRSYSRRVSFDGAASWEPRQRISNELLYFNLNTVAVPNYGEYNQACTARLLAPGTNAVYSSWSDERLSQSIAGGTGVDCYVAGLQSCVDVICAPDQTVQAGDSAVVQFCIDNCGTFADDVEYTVTDTQGWCTPPGGTVQVALPGTTCVPVTITVPPSAPVGAQTVITFSATAHSGPGATDQCTTTITVPPRPAAIDCLQSTALVEIELFGVGTTTVSLSGPTVIEHADPVPAPLGFTIATEMLQLELSGADGLLGPVALRESPLFGSRGEVTTPAAPFFPAPSFFDVFFEIDALGKTFYNKDRLRLTSTIGGLPPAGDTYVGADVLLYQKGPTGNWTPAGRVVSVSYGMGAAFDCFPPPDIDCLDTIVELRVDLTSVGTDDLVGTGPLRISRGAAIDPGDGRPEIQTEIVSMEITGSGSLFGSFQLIEPPATSSTGEIKAQSALGPYPADSFFDVGFELALPSLGLTAVPASPVHVQAVLGAVPQLGIPYVASATVPLLDKLTLAPVGTLLIARYTPQATLECAPPADVECFDSTVQVTIDLTGIGSESVALSGPATVAHGPVQDAGAGLLEIPTELLSMELTGTGALVGPVKMYEDFGQPSSGKVQGPSPGVVFPGDSYFDVWLEVETSVGRLRSAVPVRIANPALAALPLAAGTQFQATNLPVNLLGKYSAVRGQLLSVDLVVGPSCNLPTDVSIVPGDGLFYGFRTAYPNPFTGSTSVSFRLDRERQVRMRIYNVRGELVRTVQDGRLPAGFAVLDWDGRDRAGQRVTSGVYFYRVEIDGQSTTRKLVRMR